MTKAAQLQTRRYKVTFSQIIPLQLIESLSYCRIQKSLRLSIHLSLRRASQSAQIASVKVETGSANKHFVHSDQLPTLTELISARHAGCTIGITTDSDLLEAESQSEGSWLEVSENKGIFFEIKWHMRRNWSDNIVGKRNASGTAFHLSDEYHRTLPEMLGIGYLRKSLSQSLQKDLDIERPDFQKDLHSKHREVGAELEQLSQLCATAQN
jgi:hypothetical protein